MLYYMAVSVTHHAMYTQTLCAIHTHTYIHATHTHTYMCMLHTWMTHIHTHAQHKAISLCVNDIIFLVRAQVMVVDVVSSDISLDEAAR